jgi:hypothetical protein
MLGPMMVPIDRPTSGARRKMPMPDMSAASIHTNVDTRRTGTPSSDARSSFSADARTAMPMRVNRKNSPKAVTATTTTMTATTWSPLKTVPPKVKRHVLKGVGKSAGGSTLPVTHDGVQNSR